MTINVGFRYKETQYLLCFEDLLVREEHLVPHHLHPLLCVHGQRGTFHTWDITLADLQGAERKFHILYTTKMKIALPVLFFVFCFVTLGKQEDVEDKQVTLPPIYTCSKHGATFAFWLWLMPFTHIWSIASININMIAEVSRKTWSS